jgi:hypothetical protein
MPGYNVDSHSYQIPPFKSQKLDMQAVLSPNHSGAVDEHIACSAQNYGWSGIEDHGHSELCLTEENVSDGYCQVYNDTAYPDHYTNSPISPVQNPFLSRMSPSYYSQYEIQPTASSSSSSWSTSPDLSSFAGMQYYGDSLFYREDPDIMYTDGGRGDTLAGEIEPYYDDDDDPPGRVWIPELNPDGFVQPDGSAEDYAWLDHAAITGTEGWAKEDHIQKPCDSELPYHYWDEAQEGYYASYPNGPASSSYYATHLSSGVRNTPSDFTSSESPLSPLEFEISPPDLSLTLSSDTPLPPLPTFSLPPQQPFPPIIHAPRPTRTIDSASLERLLNTPELAR